MHTGVMLALSAVSEPRAGLHLSANASLGGGDLEVVTAPPIVAP